MLLKKCRICKNDLIKILIQHNLPRQAQYFSAKKSKNSGNEYSNYVPLAKFR